MRLLLLLLLVPPLHRVGGGTWRPLYPGQGEEEVAVDPFLLDERPVTNDEFRAFVAADPRWQRGRVAALYADADYLGHWRDAVTPAPGDGDRPVTRVSWWAARAYCRAQGRRLPLEREWELAARASATDPDPPDDPQRQAEILAWYSRPVATLPAAGAGPANVWGVRDLHGVVWEWVDDFQSALIVSDNREDGALDPRRFCGAGALSAQDKSDYAAFMRLAYRSSLTGATTGRALGFRCAADVEPEAR